jgi:hypothetical protein
MICGVCGNACRQHMQRHTSTINEYRAMNVVTAKDCGCLASPRLVGRACVFGSLASALALPCYGNHHAVHDPTTPVLAGVSTYD